jgi:hypothetical protein
MCITLSAGEEDIFDNKYYVDMLDPDLRWENKVHSTHTVGFDYAKLNHL